MLNENYSSNVYNELLIFFLDIYNKAFPKQKIKIKRKSFNSHWITKCLVKSSKKKKKKRLYKQFLKNRNHVKELNYEQYKTLLESLKKKSKKNYYLDLIDSRKYNIKKVGCYEGNYWKQKSHQCPSCHFYKGGKQRNIREKRNCGSA